MDNVTLAVESEEGLLENAYTRCGTDVASALACIVPNLRWG